MFIVDRIVRRARLMEPGAFAMVMATGMVSVAVTANGLRPLGVALFWLNWIAYLWLIALTVLRLALYRGQLVLNFIVLHAPAAGPLHHPLPFIRGFTLFYRASATWWIPLLVMLELWRHLWSRVPANYEVDDWNIVFPLGMYTVCAAALVHATGAHYLQPIPEVGVYASLLVRFLVPGGLGIRLLRGRRPPAIPGERAWA